MTYKLTNGGWPQRISDGAFINPETNQEYLAWCADGNMPQPADMPNAAELNAPIIAQIRELEIKWHRPFREGDNQRAAGIEAQIVALRATLKTDP